MTEMQRYLAEEVAEDLGLENVSVLRGRADAFHGELGFDGPVAAPAALAPGALDARRVQPPQAV